MLLLRRLTLRGHASPERMFVRGIVEEAERRYPQGGILQPPIGSFATEWAATMVLSGVATFILAGSEESEAA